MIALEPASWKESESSMRYKECFARDPYVETCSIGKIFKVHGWFSRKTTSYAQQKRKLLKTALFHKRNIDFSIIGHKSRDERMNGGEKKNDVGPKSFRAPAGSHLLQWASIPGHTRTHGHAQSGGAGPALIIAEDLPGRARSLCQPRSQPPRRCRFVHSVSKFSPWIAARFYFDCGFVRH